MRLVSDSCPTSEDIHGLTHLVPQNFASMVIWIEFFDSEFSFAKNNFKIPGLDSSE